MMMILSVKSLLAASACVVVASFAPTSIRRTVPSLLFGSRESVFEEVDLPDFDSVFEKIQQVSPLARSIIDNGSSAATDDQKLRWKTLESNEKKPVQQIQKLDCFGGFSTPVFRFRSKLEGPCIGEFFGRYIIDLDERRKWDAQIENVHELHAVKDLKTVNERMGDGRYGQCSRLGIGYGQTKASIITAREQMFMYGLQEFNDGSSLIWGTEMSEQYNHLLPPGERYTRSKSHLFSATLKPSGDNSFDVEYVLQLDIGGSIPNFLTTPVLIDTVKNLFETAKEEFAGATDSLQLFLQEKIKEESHINWQSLLTPM